MAGAGAADDNTEGPSEAHTAAPDWIKDLGGKYTAPCDGVGARGVGEG